MTTAVITDMSQLACLYVIELGNDRIKVGYTTAPADRLRLHRDMAHAYGVTPGREWASPPGTGTDQRERQLIDFCAARATVRVRTEYFGGVAYADAVRFAARLTGDHAAIEHLESDAYQPAAAESFAHIEPPEPAPEALRPDHSLRRRLYSVSEVAEVLRIHKATAYRRIRDGEIPSIKLGGRVLVPVTAFGALVKAAS